MTTTPDTETLKQNILSHDNNVPTHVAIIMDGNGRWAKQRGEDRIYGHFAGVESVRAALKSATELGVKYLTLYTFSTENWNRPKEEVDALMELLVKTISEEVEELNKNNVRLHAIGDLTALPEKAQKALTKTLEKTKNNSRINLVMALSYSSRWEITSAIQTIAKRLSDGSLNENEITENLISKSLTTSQIPDPELLIRTSGEYRISNFLLWQLAYTELYFTDKLWPAFRKQDFFEAIADYQNRERRFGKTSEQITA